MKTNIMVLTNTQHYFFNKERERRGEERNETVDYIVS